MKPETLNHPTNEMVTDTDGVKVQMSRYHEGMRYQHYAIRNRAYDGPGWEPSRLDEWEYGQERDIVTVPTCELSVYTCTPETSVYQEYPHEVAELIHKPYDVIEHYAATPEGREWYMRTVQEVMAQGHLPGKQSRETERPFRDAVSSLEQAAKRMGYEVATANPSWLHVVAMFARNGYTFTYPQDRQDVAAHRALLPDNLQEASWWSVAQYMNDLIEWHGDIPEAYSNMVARDQSGMISCYPLAINRSLWMQKKI
jgi:hypothetical protein